MKRIIALCVVVALCAGLVGCVSKRNSSYNYRLTGLEFNNAREKLETEVGRKAWVRGGPYLGTNSDGLRIFYADRVEVIFSSFELIADYKWEGKGTVEIKDEGYSAKFNGWIIYSPERNSYSWKVELSDERGAHSSAL